MHEERRIAGDPAVRDFSCDRTLYVRAAPLTAETVFPENSFIVVACVTKKKKVYSFVGNLRVIVVMRALSPGVLINFYRVQDRSSSLDDE